MKKLTNQRLASLRDWMATNNVSAIVLPNGDPHNNEYACPRWKGREWLTGFTGSNGTVVVTKDHALLWSDSRYYEAADATLEGTDFKLVRMSDLGVLNINQWLAKNLSEGDNVALLGGEISLLQIESTIEQLTPKGIKVETEHDFLNAIWTDRPAAPKGPIYLVDEQYTGVSCADKVTQLREKMKEQDLSAYLLGRTDESNWLMNFKGTDFPDLTTPYCHTLVTLSGVALYIDPDKVDQQTAESLTAQGVELKAYELIQSDLESLPSDTKILINPNYINFNSSQSLDHCDCKRSRPIVTDLKKVKNDTEISNLRDCMVRDGAAITKAFYWMYQQLENNAPLSELDISNKLNECREQIADYAHTSFSNIVGYAANGALNHYMITEESNAQINANNLTLIDCGGSYLSGTSDTTRTFPMGEVSEEQKKDYTLVLKCLIQSLTIMFPAGTTCAQLDGITRDSMWRHGRNYKHSTGHGIGFGLEVHEGPQNIGGSSTELMELGMLSTLEPGIYHSGEYGIRLENIIYTVPHSRSHDQDFYCFENLTFVPFMTSLVVKSLMTEDEITWLNNYQQEVFAKLSPSMNEGETTWLKQVCATI